MNKWQYTCKTGKTLRQLIDNADETSADDCIGILECVAKCYEEIGEYWLTNENTDEARDCEEYAREAQEACDDISYDEEADFVDTVDYELNNLYDYCDNTRIWILTH